jgi:hypothetical protein
MIVWAGVSTFCILSLNLKQNIQIPLICIFRLMAVRKRSNMVVKKNELIHDAQALHSVDHRS